MRFCHPLYGQRARLRRVKRLDAPVYALLTAVVVVVLGASGGAYDLVDRQSAGVVLLHAEPIASRLLGLALRLWRRREVALGLVGLEALAGS